MWLRKLEITIDFPVSFCALQVACCIFFYLFIYFLSFAHKVSMYHAFFHTLRKLLEKVEHVRNNNWFFGLLIMFCKLHAVFYLFSCTHVSMYHVFFCTLRKLLERVEHVRNNNWFVGILIVFCKLHAVFYFNFFYCTHFSMYHVFFHTLKKLLGRVEHVNKTL